MQAMANAILDKRRDRTHDTITGAITSIGEDDCSQEFTADSIKTLHEVIAKANRRKRGIVYIEDKKIEKANKPTPKPAEENVQSETLLIAQKTARRRRKEPPKAVAANEVPAGAQLALF